MEPTDVTAVQGEAKEQRREALKVSVKISGGGGGGILLLGGTLVAAAIGAAFAFHRSRAKKRAFPAPPPPEEQEEPIPVAPVHAEESVCEDEKIVHLSKAKKGLQSLIPLVEEEEIDGVIDQTEKSGEGVESEVIVEELEHDRVEEVQENGEDQKKEGDESLEIGSEEEETESSVEEEEEDGDGREERSDGTGSSSRESSAEVVWPAEVIEKEEKGMKLNNIIDNSKVKPNNTIDHSDLKLNGTVELLEIPETIKSLINETQVNDTDDDDDEEDEEDYDDDDEFLQNAEKKKEAAIPAEKTESASMAMKSVKEVETHSKVILLLLVLFLAVGLVSVAQREILHGILP